MKTLVKPILPIGATVAGATWSLSGASGAQDRILQQAPGFCTFVQSTYFDLGGMTLEDETLFFRFANVQRSAPPAIENGATADYVTEIVLLTTSPLNDTELLNVSVSGPNQTVLDFDQIVFCSNRQYSKTINEGALSTPVLMHNEVMAGAQASATDRIYLYRIGSVVAATPGAGVSTGTLPNIYVVLSVDAKEEPEYQYLMRLRRSYELQNEPDRD